MIARIDLSCPCGATISIQLDNTLDAKAIARDWQDRHTGHVAPAVGRLVVPTITPNPVTSLPPSRGGEAREAALPPTRAARIVNADAAIKVWVSTHYLALRRALQHTHGVELDDLSLLISRRYRAEFEEIAP